MFSRPAVFTLLGYPLTNVMFRGLGALVAQKYAAEGCNVAINYASSKDAAENLAAELRESYKVKAITIQGVGRVERD